MGNKPKITKLNFIKAIIHLTVITGLFMVLFDNIGWITDKDKENFLKIISEKGECHPSVLGAEKFLNDFFYPLFEYRKDIDIQIEKIQFVGTFQKKETLNGKTIREVHSGVIKVRNKNRNITKALANYSELIPWAKENKCFKWTSWIILAIGIFLQVLIYLFWEIKENSNEKLKT